MRVGQIDARQVESPRDPAGADDDLLRPYPRSVLALDHVWVDEPGAAGVLVNRDSGLLEVGSEQ